MILQALTKVPIFSAKKICENIPHFIIALRSAFDTLLKMQGPQNLRGDRLERLTERTGVQFTYLHFDKKAFEQNFIRQFGQTFIMKPRRKKL
jgi:hypothetical protein